MADELREILEGLVSNYASKDDESEYWGHDTGCGKDEFVIQTISKIKSLFKSKLQSLNFDCICNRDNLPIGVDCTCGSLDRKELLTEIEKIVEGL